MSRDPVKKASKKTPAPKALPPPKVSTAARERVREFVRANKPVPTSVMDAAERELREETQHHIVPTGTELIKLLMEGEKMPEAAGGPKAEGGHGNPVGPQGEAEAQAHQTHRPGDVDPATVQPPAAAQSRPLEAAKPAKKAKRSHSKKK